jgi:hypothetical protein
LPYSDQVATDFTEGDLAGEETSNPEDRAA